MAVQWDVVGRQLQVAFQLKVGVSLKRKGLMGLIGRQFGIAVQWDVVGRQLEVAFQVKDRSLLETKEIAGINWKAIYNCRPMGCCWTVTRSCLPTKLQIQQFLSKFLITHRPISQSRKISGRRIQPIFWSFH